MAETKKVAEEKPKNILGKIKEAVDTIKGEKNDRT